MFQRIFLTFLCQRFYIAKVWKNLTLTSYKHLNCKYLRKRHTTENANT